MCHNLGIVERGEHHDHQKASSANNGAFKDGDNMLNNFFISIEGHNIFVIVMIKLTKEKYELSLTT